MRKFGTSLLKVEKFVSVQPFKKQRETKKQKAILVVFCFYVFQGLQARASILIRYIEFSVFEDQLSDASIFFEAF